MATTLKKRFDIYVQNPDEMVSKTFELDKHITGIKGLLLTSDMDDLLYYRGSQKIEINKEEIFPEGYESKLLMSGLNVSPNQRYYDLGLLPPGNRSVKVDYKDTSDLRTNFISYRVTLYLICEIEVL